MKKNALFPFLFFLFCFALADAQENSRQIDSLLKKEYRSKNFSGVLLVDEKGKMLFFGAAGYRDFANKVPLERTDIFELASVSKQFTAMIIMMLQEKGLLAYDDPMEKYLSLPYTNITIRHLLTHTSGLPDYQEMMDKHWDKSKVAGNEEVIEYLNRYQPPALFPPGSKYEYSNTGYLLLASIAEKASGRKFTDLCRDWIFTPLGMHRTDIRTNAEKAETPGFALGHIYVPEQSRYVRADSFPSSDYTIWLGNRRGPGRISSTAEDLLKWDQALYTGKLVKQATLEEAYTPYRLNNGDKTKYGFGWMLKEDSVAGRIVYHDGDNPGYHTLIFRCIDIHRTIILLSNNAHEDMGYIVDAVMGILR